MTDTLIREIARVQNELKRVTSSEQRAGTEIRLQRARDAATRGREYLALHELSLAWRTQSAYTLSAEIRSRVKDMDDFRREWAAAGEPRTLGASASMPLVVAALATSAEAVAPATYRASLPYAEDAGLESGLYYLGDAHAASRFAAFCRTLRFEPAGARPPLRSIAAEMDRFERDVVKLYDKADAGARRAFISINVAMKIARERDASRDYSASLLQYLLARYQLALLVTSEASADAASRLSAFSAALKGADHTIAQLFFEIAAASLETPDGSRGATAIADFVIPEYVEIVKK